MAAPLDALPSSMVPSTDPDHDGADLDPAVAAQLVNKTTSLTISGLTSEDDEPSVQGTSLNPLACGLSGVTHTPSLWLPVGTAHPSSDTVPDDCREGPSGRAMATSPTGFLNFSYCSSTVHVYSRTPTEAEEPNFPGTIISIRTPKQLLDLPTEVLLHILSFLEVCDLLATSRTSHLLRSLSLTPHLHRLRLRRARAALPPMLASPARPSLADLVRRSIVLTRTTFASRRLARSLASIRLARRLAARPSAEALVERCVLPPECLPRSCVAPALVAPRRAVERERVKDRLRAWVGSVWAGGVKDRAEGVRRWEERAGVGRVWRLRRFWERVGRGEAS